MKAVNNAAFTENFRYAITSCKGISCHHYHHPSLIFPHLPIPLNGIYPSFFIIDMPYLIQQCSISQSSLPSLPISLGLKF